MIKKYFKFRL